MARPDRIVTMPSGSPSYPSTSMLAGSWSNGTNSGNQGDDKGKNIFKILESVSGLLPGVGSVLSPIFGLISGIFGRNSQEDINAQNIAMQRETNALNYQMFKEQQGYDLAMYEKQNADAIAFWDMQNEYNSPEQMRKRYEDAGFNPILAMQGGAGTASSINQASIPSQTPPQMVAPQISGNPTVAGMEAMASSQATMASIVETINATSTALESLKGLKIDNRYKDKVINKQLGYQDEQTRQLKQATDFATRMESVRASMEVQQLQSQISQNILTKLQIEAQEAMNSALPQQLQLSLLNSAQDLTLKCLQGDISKQELRNRIAAMYETYSRISLNEKQEQLTDEKITTEQFNQNKVLADTSAVQADNKVKWAVVDAVISATTAEMMSNQSAALLAKMKTDNMINDRNADDPFNSFMWKINDNLQGSVIMDIFKGGAGYVSKK